MKYMGSKSRIAKYIVPILQKLIDDNNISTYIEPFCGGCNVIDKIICKNKIASDINPYLIELLKHRDEVKNLPNFVTKEHYSEVREAYNNRTDKFPEWYIGAIGFLASYNGRFFDGGYAGIVTTKEGKTRNYYDEARRNFIEQLPLLKNICFELGSYDDFYTAGFNNLIYCDIPYKNTKQYGYSKNFDHNRFWQWVRDISKDNIVIVSEQEAPEDFECIWEQPIKRTIDNNKRVNVVEKLFKVKEILQR